MADSRRRVLRWVGRGLLALVTLLEVMTMGDAGLGKFQSYDGWRHWFGVFGYPAWLSTVVGLWS